ncbi:chorismate mutase [Jiangella sp. DSM 45060]|uniref:chorismate mutase n=1 Tax=Jiangella sp. DSM 45060 TaxID=1798224 RepID=UPI00087AF2C6|nr:chorismate mutase [Jiangella sp. DSM 45060]SDS75236.1 Chorismate mutase [Jiangella sp. DSM 45060]
MTAPPDPATRTASADAPVVPAAFRDAVRPPVVAPPGAGGDLDHDAVPAGSVTLVDTLDPAVVEAARRHGRPVVVNLGERPELAAAAVAAGADGLWLDAPGAAAAAQAREAAVRVAPLVRSAVPDTVPACRAAIDAVDAALATLLEHRVALAGRVQRLKPVGGHAGRDPDREAAIVVAMAERAPSLPPESLARIVTAIIEAGLDAAERDDSDEPPVWRL